MDEDWEASEALGLSPWHYWGPEERGGGAAGGRELGCSLPEGTGEQFPTVVRVGWGGVCLFFPRRALGKGKEN